ncbi:hypothetical protein V2J09_007222 [Rumex salicifolius]
MEQNEDQDQEQSVWSELTLPSLLFEERLRNLHATIETEWDSLRQSACQTAAGRGLWKHVTNDPLAELLAGETHLRKFYEKIRKDCLKNAREISGVILAVRTLWFDTRLEEALSSFGDQEAQVIILGAGMDTRAYRLDFLSNASVFEVDFGEVLQMKEKILQAAQDSTEEQTRLISKAKSITRVAADLKEGNWLEKLKSSGFMPEKLTVWILEGILYYLLDPNALSILNMIANYCNLTQTVLLADFMNKQSTKLPNSSYHFYSDWPDQLLPSIGFSDVKLSQIGDPDAHFGLTRDPLNLFNKLRGIPRTVQTNPDDGTPCCRLYLVEASGSPDRIGP